MRAIEIILRSVPYPKKFYRKIFHFVIKESWPHIVAADTGVPVNDYRDEGSDERRRDR